MGELRLRATYILLAAVLLWVAMAADASGEFYERHGVALTGYDPVAYFTLGKPVQGSPAYTAEFRGSRFQFASPANRNAFAANPARYAPQYGGFCAYGVARGYKAAIDPAAFTIAGDKLYLNYSRRIHRRWSADIPGFIASADRNWPEVSKQTKIIE
jgi:YHS domain-containing protein